MKKKVLKAGLLALAAIVLVVATVLTTMAYLTASTAVSNVFTVGNVSIEMYESKVDADGQAITPQVKVDSNCYHLIPDKTYVKDPTIYITSKLEEDKMYLFVKSNNQIRTIEAANVEGAPTDAPKSMRQQMEANGWVEFVQSGDGIEIVWVYGTRDPNTGVITPTAVDPTTVQKRGDGTDGPAGEIRLCETFTVAKDANVSLYAAAKVSFTAFAIQTSGLENNAKDAWTAIKEAYPYEGGIINPVNPYNPSYDAYDPVPSTSVNP